MLEYSDRVAVVTGAGQGLGREHALLLAARGARVLVNDYGAERASDVAAAITAAGGIAVANHESVSTPEGGRSIIDHAIDAFGRLDILINNAGIIRDRAFHNMSNDQVTEVLDVHLGGAFWVTGPAYKVMREAGYGRLVFTTSLSGLLGNFGQANYAAAKMGVIGLAKVLATEGAARGIRSNVIAPLAQTEMANSLSAFEVKQLSAKSVAGVVAYLAHADCDLNGEILSAVGGRIARYFIGLTPGVYLPDLTPEDVVRELDRIVGTTGFSEPRTMSDEIDSVLTTLNEARPDPS